MAKRRKFVPQRRPNLPRINEQIQSETLRVLMDQAAAEVMSRARALQLAREMGLDLVEVSPGQEPPVCKIIDFGRYKYEQQKKKKEQSKHQHVIHIKEIKLRPKIGIHDYDIKKRNAIGFLEKGDKVKVSLRFRGREMAHPELGMKLVNKMAKDLEVLASIETPAKMEGRQIIMVLASRGKKKKPDEPTAKKEVDEKPHAGETDNPGS